MIHKGVPFPTLLSRRLKISLLTVLAHHSLHILECGDFSESAGQDMMLRMKGLEAMVLTELDFRIVSGRAAATLIIDQAFTFVSYDAIQCCGDTYLKQSL